MSSCILCIYIKKLADIDIKVLEQLCKETIAYLNEHHVVVLVEINTMKSQLDI
jgi:hypothetical protein